MATDDKESGKIRRLANASQQNMELRVVVVEDSTGFRFEGPSSHGVAQNLEQSLSFL